MTDTKRQRTQKIKKQIRQLLFQTIPHYFSKKREYTNIHHSPFSIHDSRNGFSLIQVIVSIVILTVSLSATVSLVGTTIQQVTLNKNRITAIYLAQEGLELARNIRDSAWQQNYPWDCGFGETYAEGDIFTIVPTALPLTPPPTPDCQKDFGAEIKAVSSHTPTRLSIDFLPNKYGFIQSDSGTQTPFNRILKITDIHNDDHITVTAKVSWGDEEVSLSEILSNWYKK